ncbi:MAG: hypothetical protein M3R41_02870 [Pseudomonadota bacterium]|nr:hypothetical protein [Pseudomonadota bacterium]
MTTVNIGTVWDRTSAFLGDHGKALWPIAMGGIALPYAGMTILAPAAQAADTGGKLLINLAVLVLGLVIFWGSLAITAFTLDPPGGRDPAMRLAARRLPLAIGIGLMIAAGVLVLCVPIGIAMAAGGFDFAAAAAGRHPQMASGPALAIAVLYALLLIVALIWLGARLALTNPVVLIERQGARSPWRSFQLTRGVALKIVGVLILYVIVSSVASMAARFVFGSIFALVFVGQGAFSLAAILTAIVVAMVSTIFSVLAAAFTGKLYLAVRDAREAIVDPR